MEENVTKAVINLNQSETTTESNIFETINSIIDETIKNITVNVTKNNADVLTPKGQDVKTFENHFEQVWLWIFGIYCGNIALGIIFNGISFFALMKTKRNGELLLF